MILTEQQRFWLRKLIDHPHRDYWLDPNEDEIKLVEDVLDKSSYSDSEGDKLNDIVKYYKRNQAHLGTLKNTK
jgi:hypothetical protein